ncbi:MAG: TonB-dependent receptor plug domain-containing protein, partial [Gammaproteobacteria bacterium]
MPTNAVFRLSPLALSLASILASQPALSANTLPPLQVQAATIVDITQRQSAGEEVTNAPSADAGEALRAVPGVSGVHMGGHGVDPVIRGQGMTRVNVLIDGAFIHGACPNRMDPPTSYAPIESF